MDSQYKNLPQESLPQKQNLAKRREFLKTSAKLGIATFGALGVNALFGAGATGAQNLANAQNPAGAQNLANAIPLATLNNGVKIPMVGIGTFNMGSTKEVQSAIESALEVGYRHIDTAQRYGSEAGIGAALKASGIKREEVFITTKLLPRFANEKDAKKAFEDSLKRLQSDYVDLFLLHWDVNDTYGAWRAMSKLHKEGRIKALGVCNFSADRLVDFCLNNEIKPAINQVEFSPLYQRTDLQKVMQEYGVKLVSWSSFGRGREGANGVLDNPALAKIAKKHHKSVAQIALRWLIEQDIIVLPKTTKKERMVENISIFDFALDSNDKAQIAKLNKGKSLFFDPQDVKRIEWLNSDEYNVMPS